MRQVNQYSALSVIVIVAIITVSVGISQTESTIVKRSFVRLGCQGTFDRSIFSKLDKVCEDCYEIYMEPGLHSECRKNCFNNQYFDGCLDALLLSDNRAEYGSMVNTLYGNQ